MGRNAKFKKKENPVMVRLLMVCFVMVFLAGCLPRPVQPISETRVDPTQPTQLEQQISSRLKWLEPAQAWHNKCLFGKPINQVRQAEQALVLSSAEMMFRAHVEEQRGLYRNAGFVYRRAADQGVGLAFAKMGQYLMDGLGAPVNVEGAQLLYYQSAMLDCAEGQFLYGQYLNSDKVSFQNPVSAYAWVRLAADQGHLEAEAYMNRLKGFFSPSQLTLANQKNRALRMQINTFNQGETGMQLVRCVTAQNTTPFVTRLRACQVMQGRFRAF